MLVSYHQSKTFLILKSLMTSLDPVEIERAKLHSVKCPICKINLIVRPTEKVCPVCGNELPKPGKR